MIKRLFNFYKFDRPSFEIKEERLEQITVPDMANEPICDIDETHTGYEDPRWIERSNEIKFRDNYTCQLCHAFNPMQGYYNVKQGEYDTIHHYSWAGNSKYKIFVRVQGYSLTITFDFMPNFHLAMPRLNVHHKLYYRNHDLWDYQDDCLVTLCEKCHHYVHSLNDVGIPIVEVNADGHTVLIGKTRPKPYLSKLDHTDLDSFRPLALVEEKIMCDNIDGLDLADFMQAKLEGKPWYDYHNVLDDNVVNYSCFTTKNHHSTEYTQEEIKNVADFIINDFVENILGFSHYPQSL